jgi:hypothetical protein
MQFGWIRRVVPRHSICCRSPSLPGTVTTVTACPPASSDLRSTPCETLVKSSWIHCRRDHESTLRCLRSSDPTNHNQMA